MRDTVILDVIAASARSELARQRCLAKLTEAEVREVHALYYAARDGMPLDEARKLDRGQPREVIEDTLIGKLPLGRFLSAALIEGGEENAL